MGLYPQARTMSAVLGEGRSLYVDPSIPTKAIPDCQSLFSIREDWLRESSIPKVEGWTSQMSGSSVPITAESMKGSLQIVDAFFGSVACYQRLRRKIPV